MVFLVRRTINPGGGYQKPAPSHVMSEFTVIQAKARIAGQVWLVTVHPAGNGPGHSVFCESVEILEIKRGLANLMF